MRGASNLVVRTALILVSLVALSRCGGDTPASPSTTARDGTWRGAGASGGASTTNIGVTSLEFVVQNNVITRFTLTFRFTPGSTGCSFTATGTATIANNAFTYAFSSGGLTATITGTFSSNTQGTGNTGQVNFAGVSCGGTITGFASGDSITFSKA